MRAWHDEKTGCKVTILIVWSTRPEDVIGVACGRDLLLSSYVVDMLGFVAARCRPALTVKLTSHSFVGVFGFVAARSRPTLKVKTQNKQRPQYKYNCRAEPRGFPT